MPFSCRTRYLNWKQPNEPQQIKAVAPRLSFSGLISHGESTLSFIGDGDDPQQQAAFGDALQISAGRNLSADDPLGIIVGEGLARNLGVMLGTGSYYWQTRHCGELTR